jgi:hypothetical protein
VVFGVDELCVVLVRGRNVVWTEVERPNHVERDLAVEPEALKPDRGDLVAALIEGTNLCSAPQLGSAGGGEGKEERD